jgi:hypothetical protein
VIEAGSQTEARPFAAHLVQVGAWKLPRWLLVCFTKAMVQACRGAAAHDVSSGTGGADPAPVPDSPPGVDSEHAAAVVAAEVVAKVAEVVTEEVAADAASAAGTAVGQRSRGLLSALAGGDFGSVLGQGASATVHNLGDGLVAKRVANDPGAAIWEMQCLLMIQPSPNIVKLVGHMINRDGSFDLVLAHGGRSLTQVLHDRGHRFPVHELLNIIHQLGQALASLGEQGYVHKDVKPDNVLYDNKTVVIIDFGVADYTSSPGTEIIGTFGYMAPEIFVPDSPIASADAFSFGALVLALLVKTQWFENEWVAHYVHAGCAAQDHERARELACALADARNRACDGLQARGENDTVVQVLDGLLQVDTRLRWTSKRAADAAFAELRTGD